MAAGLGFKTFTTGEVLTAADTNGYLMQGVLVFASAAARDAAITSPQEGQCCYLKDTDAVLTYSGSAWVGFDDSNAIQNAIVDAKGDLITATAADTPARLGVGADGTTLVADSSTATGLKWATAASGSTFSGCSLRQSSGQSISNTTQTDLTFDTEDFDTDGYHSTATNTNRITIPAGKSGYFLVTARTAFGANTSGTRINWLLKNGSTYLSTVYVGAAVADNTSVVTSAIISLVATDYITINAYQTSGTSLTTATDQGKTNFSIQYLGA